MRPVVLLAEGNFIDRLAVRAALRELVFCELVFCELIFCELMSMLGRTGKKWAEDAVENEFVAAPDLFFIFLFNPYSSKELMHGWSRCHCR